MTVAELMAKLKRLPQEAELRTRYGIRVNNIVRSVTRTVVIVGIDPVDDRKPKRRGRPVLNYHRKEARMRADEIEPRTETAKTT